MSTLGQSRRFWPVRVMSAYPPIATKQRTCPGCPKSANIRLPTNQLKAIGTLRQKLSNLRQQLARAIGLGYIGIAAGFTRLGLITAQGIRSDDDDRNRPQ